MHELYWIGANNVVADSAVGKASDLVDIGLFPFVGFRAFDQVAIFE